MKAALVLCTLGLLAAGARAGQTWSFDVSTSGQDVFWTSPTGLDPGAAVYNGSYAIFLVEADVVWNGIPFPDLDVTSLIPAQFQAGSGELPGPAPIEFLNAHLAFPEPPATPGVQGDVVIGLDAAGFASLQATNIVLGTITVVLPVFGTQTVTVQSIRLVGEITTHPTWSSLGGGVAGTHGQPLLSTSGSLQPGNPLTFDLTSALENTLAHLVIGLSALNVPFAGGTLVPAVDALVPNLPTDALGEFHRNGNWPAGIPSGTTYYFQFWVEDPLAPFGLAGSNAVAGVTP